MNLNALVDLPFSMRVGISNSDILKTCLMPLCLGKNDFDAIEGSRQRFPHARALR